MAAAFVLDRASILERLGGDEEIYAMMVNMFVADVESNCAALAAALAAGDVECAEARGAYHQGPAGDLLG